MDPYKELQDALKAAAGGGRRVTLYQGTVLSVSGRTCDIAVGGLTVPGVRLRASEADCDGETLVTPKAGSAVIVGSLSGDLSQLAVLRIDRAETVSVNGGKLGGLVNIAELTDRLNALVKAFNGHTHQVAVAHPGGTFTTAAPGTAASEFSRGDYEDEKVKH